jgi:hypothetical protein
LSLVASEDEGSTPSISTCVVKNKAVRYYSNLPYCIKYGDVFGFDFVEREQERRLKKITDKVIGMNQELRAVA